MLLEPFIATSGVISLAGSSDLGKSYLLLQLCNAVVKGNNDFLGFKLNPIHKSAIYLSTEDDEYSLCPRLTHMAQNADLALYENIRFFFDPCDLEKRLDNLLTEKPADIVVIDTFSDIYCGEMNQANKVRSFIVPFKGIASRHKTSIIFNHHCGKNNDYKPPHKDNLLGSQGFESSMRTVIELRKDFIHPNQRHLCIVKGNYLNEHFKTQSFVLDFNFEKGFSNTGQRIDFDKLVKSDPQESSEKDLLKQKIIDLKKGGLSYSKIATKLKEEGINVSRSTIGNICKEDCPSIQKPIEQKLDGHAA